MRVVIDRIEDGVASVELENGELVNAPAKLFEGCGDGDIVYITVNREETQKEKEKLLKELEEMLDK